MSERPVLLPYADQDFLADPFPLYGKLREDGPVRRVVVAGGLDAWLVTRYEEGLAALSDPRLSSDVRDASDPRLLAQLPETERESMLSNMLRSDPPDHTRLRRLVSKAFTARRVAQMRPRIQAITDGLLDGIVPAGRADLVADFALPLPVAVIGELLGVPVDDQHDFQRWTDRMIMRGAEPPDPAVVNEAWQHMRAYVTDLIRAKRAHPGDDLLSGLIAARDEEARLSEDELIAMVFLLLAAGYITTVNLISGGIAMLLAHPGQLDLLRSDPELLGSAVEEFLRYDGPVSPGIARFAREDVEIAGVTVPRGATVLIASAIADRDPARFPDPDRLDITRPDNAHLAFGHGVHYCLGAPLARLEGHIAIGTALRRLPGLALAVPPDEIRWRPGGLRGPLSLPVTFRS
ncbi:cytochrome P450 [Streptomyces virginiae]|uniref:cytochrome P450 family protein n=1 Tax=Streptomyces TaxID=1883 RepID=UPI0006AFA58B|nr:MULTISPECIES: cytochrome P450 [unclassified Streptomyces]KOU70414.1 cytochrome P450 [Streptomyces sp. IGB124]KOU75604.1 cytochrome P450 [Streptomyces sp. XY66]KOU93799.1 cytochrome P450 [Streptomyces sp. XY58]KOV07994.1 cytochrome P450 [Streptomyces sp. XY37]KOV27699.1 cytochrome P450 [Streptomyces sp. XY413]